MIKNSRPVDGLIQRFLFPEYCSCHVCGRYISSIPIDVLCERCRNELIADAIGGWNLKQTVGNEKANLDVYSAFFHQSTARELVHRLKYSGDLYAAMPLAERMAYVYAMSAAELSDTDIVIPVPLHPDRMRKRGYNQAEVLTRLFAEHTGIHMDSSILVKTKALRSQVGRGREGRIESAQNAFSAVKAVNGLRIIVIDDVCTTGSTALSCASALLQNGAEMVKVLTATRA